jgi:hypothetical protein
VDCTSRPRKPLLEATVPPKKPVFENPKIPRHSDAKLRSSDEAKRRRGERRSPRGPKSRGYEGRKIKGDAELCFISVHAAPRTIQLDVLMIRLSRRLNSCSPDIGDKGPVVALQAFDGLKTRPGDPWTSNGGATLTRGRVRAKSEYIMPRPWSHFLHSTVFTSRGD